MFTIGDSEYCPRTSASMIWNNGVLEFHVFGWGPVVVRHQLDGEQLVWAYADGSVTRMNRICQLPVEHKIPTPRGPRHTFFSNGNLVTCRKMLGELVPEKLAPS